VNDFGFPYEERALTCDIDIGLVIEHLYIYTCPNYVFLGGGGGRGVTNLVSKLMATNVIDYSSTTF
jgi:hypothetical protein